ncbi:hypothetical protein KU06112801_2020005 [Flavobacterium psychrophilum]|uniref:hypothetical protein n=1 Tax=Flavobacterium psychrophilum TaxID=96345 RepID=UPI000B7C12B8|nr:hypothetical protein [Flavobacterium psychrophilum]SNB10939.1 hypothetical protein KU06112801_2020005 [Flavobacterium psychrophilum]
MKIYKQAEIVKLTEKQIDELIINNTYEFETQSKDSDKPKKFKALVVDQSLAEDRVTADLTIIIENEEKQKVLNILNILSMKYVC